MDLQKALKEAYMSGIAEAQIGDQIKNVAFDYEGMANAYAKTKVENLGLFNVSNSVEKILKPKYMNTEFTWGQIEKAIKKSTDC